MEEDTQTNTTFVEETTTLLSLAFKGGITPTNLNRKSTTTNEPSDNNPYMDSGANLEFHDYQPPA